MKILGHCALFALFVLSGCESMHVVAVEAGAPSESAQHPALPPARPATSATPAQAQPNNDCWWYQHGERNLVAVWVSPRLPGQVPGGFRFVNVFLHDGRDKPGLLLHSSPVRQTQRGEVGVSSDGRSVQVTPIAGKTWADVVGRDDLNVQVRQP